MWDLLNSIGRVFWNFSQYVFDSFSTYIGDNSVWLVPFIFLIIFLFLVHEVVKKMTGDKTKGIFTIKNIIVFSLLFIAGVYIFQDQLVINIITITDNPIIPEANGNIYDIKGSTLSIFKLLFSVDTYLGEKGIFVVVVDKLVNDGIGAVLILAWFSSKFLEKMIGIFLSFYNQVPFS